MGEVKKRFRGLSDWLTYELETDAIEPPILKVRVKPIQRLGILDAFGAGTVEQIRMSEYVFQAVVDAVEDWDLTEEGQPIIPTRGNKLLHLGPRLSDRLKGEGQTLLGLAIFNWATDQNNFLKN